MKPIQEIEFIFMNKWVKTKYAFIFRFSNKAVQACFKDKTEIFMHTINETITYTNKNGDKIIYPISKSLNSSNYEMNKRVKYTMNVLTYMIKENIKKKGKNDLIIKDKAGEN
jgi:polo-like kinase 1